MGFIFGPGRVVRLEVFGGPDDGLDLTDQVHSVRIELQDLCPHPGVQRRAVDRSGGVLHSVVCPDCGAWAAMIGREPALPAPMEFPDTEESTP
jgi:hypothetical protein